jgi:hypothetical protein
VIPMRDPDCNQVTLSEHEHVTYRCLLPEGHDDQLPHDELVQVVSHKHRAHVPTVTAVFPLAAGRRRRTPGDHVADGANRVDAALRRWDAVAKFASLVRA